MTRGNKQVSEWAYRIARNQGRDVQTMTENLEATAKLARREALVEAAKVADALGKRYDESCKRAGVISVMSGGCFNAAAEIRALIDKEENAQCPPPKC